MPIENITSGIFSGQNVNLGVKSFLILFLVFYVIFSLILFRQIQIMDKTLPTVPGPFLKFLAILHVGIALALSFFVAGLF